MREIVVPRRVIPRRTRFQCDVCKKIYRTAERARECENGLTESQKFHVGDRVRSRHTRHCICNRRYYARGRVTKVEGPILFDPEVMLKCNAEWPMPPPDHVYEYMIACVCSHCGREKTCWYFSSEIVRT